jgi:hypothetical protein
MEGKLGHLDENLFVEFVAANEAVAVLPVMDSARVADSVKDFVKPSTSMKGLLRREFLNPSPAVKALTPHTSLLESVVLSSTLEVKGIGVVGIPSPLGGCVTPTIWKSDDFRVNGLSQSQKWPVGLDGEDGDSPYPLNVLPPNMALD